MNQIPSEGEYCTWEEKHCPCFADLSDEMEPICPWCSLYKKRLEGNAREAKRLPQCIRDQPQISIRDQPCLIGEDCPSCRVRDICFYSTEKWRVKE